MITKKTIVINGDHFSTLEGFYFEVDKVLTKDLNWETGHNLDAFNDLLRGGFGVHDNCEPITLIWKNVDKSKTDLDTSYQILVDIIRDNDHIEFVES